MSDTTDTVNPTDTETGEILERMAEDGHDTSTEATEGTETPPDDPEAPEPAQEDETPKGPNSEAKKYRLRLRDTEAERDELTGRVESLQRQLIESHIERHGLNPNLLFDTGLNAADVLGEDGLVDAGKIQGAVTEARQRYGLHGRPDPAQQASDAVQEPNKNLLFGDRE